MGAKRINLHISEETKKAGNKFHSNIYNIHTRMIVINSSMIQKNRKSIHIGKL